MFGFRDEVLSIELPEAPELDGERGQEGQTAHTVDGPGHFLLVFLPQLSFGELLGLGDAGHLLMDLEGLALLFIRSGKGSLDNPLVLAGLVLNMAGLVGVPDLAFEAPSGQLAHIEHIGRISCGHQRPRPHDGDLWFRPLVVHFVEQD